MTRENMKMVNVAGKQYQIKRMTAQEGSWVAMLLLTKLLPMGMHDKMNTGSLPGRSVMSKEEFQNIQQSCLAVCFLQEHVSEHPVLHPVLMQDGRLAIKDLEFDVVAVMALTLGALEFNVAPFFEDDALAQMLAGLSSLKLPSASK